MEGRFGKASLEQCRALEAVALGTGHGGGIVDVVQEASQAPQLLVFAKALGKALQDGLRGQGMLEQPCLDAMAGKQAQCFFPFYRVALSFWIAARRPTDADSIPPDARSLIRLHPSPAVPSVPSAETPVLPGATGADRHLPERGAEPWREGLPAPPGAPSGFQPGKAPCSGLAGGEGPGPAPHCHRRCAPPACLAVKPPGRTFSRRIPVADTWRKALPASTLGTAPVPDLPAPQPEHREAAREGNPSSRAPRGMRHAPQERTACHVPFLRLQ